MKKTIFVERKVRYSALFTNLVGWHAGAVSFLPSDVILAKHNVRVQLGAVVL